MALVLKRFFFLVRLQVALNSIVPLFSSDDVIKCAFLGVILTARRLSVSISLMIYCKTHVMYHLCKNDL